MEEQPPAEEQPQEPAEPEPANGEHALYVCVLIVEHDSFVDGKSVFDGHFHVPLIARITNNALNKLISASNPTFLY